MLLDGEDTLVNSKVVVEGLSAKWVSRPLDSFFDCVAKVVSSSLAETGSEVRVRGSRGRGGRRRFGRERWRAELRGPEGACPARRTGAARVARGLLRRKCTSCDSAGRGRAGSFRGLCWARTVQSSCMLEAVSRGERRGATGSKAGGAGSKPSAGLTTRRSFVPIRVSGVVVCFVERCVVASAKVKVVGVTRSLVWEGENQ